MKYLKVLYVQVLIAIFIGILLGHFYPDLAVKMQPLGKGFINLIKMIIAPLIFSTVVTGIAGMNDIKAVGKTGGMALVYFTVITLTALAIGLVVVNIAQPGVGMNVDVSTFNAADKNIAAQYAGKAKDNNIVNFFLNIIPSTFVSAFTSGEILQVLLVAILFAFALNFSGEKGKLCFDLIKSLSEVLFKVIGIIMHVAPIGAFGAMAFTIGKFGISSLANLLGLIGTFYLTALLFVIVVLGIIAKFTGFSIFKFIKYIKEELLLVLGTSSSESALPHLMGKLEHMGCKKSVVGLVVPTGYSFNLDGTNIYMTLAVLFIAQAMNIDLTLTQQLTILGVAMLTSKGASGVTGAGFVTLAGTLMVVPDIPVAGMALILGIDRFMSEVRALTNFVGNGVATVVVSKWENALDENQMHQALK